MIIDITLTEDIIQGCKEHPSVFGLAYDVLEALVGLAEYETGFKMDSAQELYYRMPRKYRDLMFPLLYEEDNAAEQRLRELCPLDISIETDEREY